MTRRVCPTCKGNARVQVKETFSDGDTTLSWYECGDCNAKGYIDDEEVDSAGNFDIDGEDDESDEND